MSLEVGGGGEAGWGAAEALNEKFLHADRGVDSV